MRERKVLQALQEKVHTGHRDVEFEDGERVDLPNPPWPLVEPLVWW